MTAVVETAVREAAAPSRAEVMRESAEAFADRHLIDAVEEFLRAVEESREAWARLDLTDTGGWGGLQDEAERLQEVAEDAWAVVNASWFLRDDLPSDVVEKVESAAAEYVGRRRRPVGHAVGTGDWRDSVGAIDWSKGRPS